MERDLHCLRCGGEMGYAFTEDIQLGKAGVIRGIWPNIWAGAMRVELYCCKDCGRLELFAAENGEALTDSTIPQVTCPNCGQRHDFDYPRCPFCKHTY